MTQRPARRAGQPTHPGPVTGAHDQAARRVDPPVQPGDRIRLLHATSDVAKRQQSEAPLDEVYLAVKRQDRPRSDELAQCSWEARKWYRLFDHLSIREDGVLMVRLLRNGRWITTVCCPPSLRDSVVSETHQAAHLGEWKTTRRVQLNWHWPGLYAIVRQHVRSCQACQIGKKSGAKAPKSRHRLYAGRPWQRVAADLAGPLDKTERGNQWILVITDHFTRWTDAFALPNARAETVARVLEERIFSTFGVPEVLHTDQGAQFEGELMHELCNLWGVDKTRTAPYRPQGNGQCERVNRVMADSLRALLQANGRVAEDWDLLVPQIMKVIRATPHATTGETANYLMFARELRLPSNLLHQVEENEQASVTEYVGQMKDRLARAYESLRGQQLEVRTDDSHEPSLFKEGDYVFMRSKQRKKGKATKLQMQYVGPYLVIQALPFHTYRLRRDGVVTIQHEARLKLYASSERGFDPVLPRDGPRALLPPGRKKASNVVARYPFPDEREATYYVEQSVPRQRFRVRADSDSDDEPQYPQTCEITSLPDETSQRLARDFPETAPIRASAQLTLPAPEAAQSVPRTLGPWEHGNPVSGHHISQGREPEKTSLTDSEHFPSLGEAMLVPRRTRSGRLVRLPKRLENCVE
jgi:transposase InsO family protein